MRVSEIKLMMFFPGVRKSYPRSTVICQKFQKVVQKKCRTCNVYSNNLKPMKIPKPVKFWVF